jgi:hypothetical protein
MARRSPYCASKWAVIGIHEIALGRTRPYRYPGQLGSAWSGPTMRFVPVKTAEQQGSQLLHRGRERLVRQRTMLMNALRAHLAAFGTVAAQGLRRSA